MQKPLECVPFPAPSATDRRGRSASFAAQGQRRGRYHLPEYLDSPSPVGFRVRLPLSRADAAQALALLSLERPTAFVGPVAITEQELFEECSLGLLSARQSTNYRGHREVILGPSDAGLAAELLGQLQGLEAPALSGASHVHVVLTKPYRNLFTLFLTFVGHKPGMSLATVPIRGLRKRFQYADDIPTIGFLRHLHLGILADQLERAAVLASAGTRQAQVFQKPFCDGNREANRPILAQLEALCGLTARDRRIGWRIGLVAQVGAVPSPLPLPRAICRRIAATLLAFRSERLLPGVNQDGKAPPPYQSSQPSLFVPDALVEQAGRAAYNAFEHWTGVDRDTAKHLLLMERVDTLTPGKENRLAEILDDLGTVSDHVIRSIPTWADLGTGKTFSRNADRGRKAFALAGQRIYITGLSRREITARGLPWELGIRALGAAAARSALCAELMGVTELPGDCDMLAGICLMAGPVNQNDVGKQFFGHADLLADAFPDRDPTSLLVWTLKAKTVADPIGNEEQLLNKARKGPLVDLRSGPHELVKLRRSARLEPMRRREGRVNTERAFHDMSNFVADANGREIPGNRGSAWPRRWASETLWELPIATG
jgi:hypothetical protein